TSCILFHAAKAGGFETSKLFQKVVLEEIINSSPTAFHAVGEGCKKTTGTSTTCGNFVDPSK
ncbi:unnamed protein product, partial [Amoebophrya sp. A120]